MIDIYRYYYYYDHTKSAIILGAPGSDCQPCTGFAVKRPRVLRAAGCYVLVFSNSFNGGFNDEKNSGIEIIHGNLRNLGTVLMIHFLLCE